MMMIKKYMVILFVVFLQTVTEAQNSGMYNPNLSQNSNRLAGKLMGEVYYLNTISNAYYFLQQEWTFGTVTLKDGDVFENIKIRYMAFGDELVAYNSNNHMLFIVDKNTVKQFTFNTTSASGFLKERKFINLDSLDVFLNRTYFEELYSGSAKLLVFHQIEETKVSPYADASGRMFDTEFHLKDLYFILSDVKGFTKFQLRNRSLVNIYPENKKEIRKQLRKSKISIGNESSAIQAFDSLDKAGLLK